MNTYLQHKTLFPPLIKHTPSPKLHTVVVIPAYDEDHVLLSLYALKKCDLPEGDVEIIVLVNDAETDTPEVKEKNKNTVRQITDWAKRHNEPRRKFYALYAGDLPKKHAGAGLARKIGMDEACFRLEKAGNPNGIILCYDADSLCEKNYLLETAQFFQKHPKIQAAGIHFEHPLSGAAFDEVVYKAITLYELHLRYFVQAQRWAGFPFAYQTIGSSMAVRSNAYQQQGGMNRRQAGEDFYFLHKFIQIGKFGEIKTTKIIPSPRPSHRVPFGTGKAVGEILSQKTAYRTYAPQSFVDLKLFFDTVEKLYALTKSGISVYLAKLPESIRSFLLLYNFEEKLLEIQSHTSSPETFTKRFFKWFNAFLLMKYMHYARDRYYPDIAVEEATKWLLETTGEVNHPETPEEMLILLREKC